MKLQDESSCLYEGMLNGMQTGREKPDDESRKIGRSGSFTFWKCVRSETYGWVENVYESG